MAEQYLVRHLRDADGDTRAERPLAWCETVRQVLGVEAFTCEGAPVTLNRLWFRQRVARHKRLRRRGPGAEIRLDAPGVDLVLRVASTPGDDALADDWQVWLNADFVRTPEGHELTRLLLDEGVRQLNPFYAAIEHQSEVGLPDRGGDWPLPVRLHWLTYVSDDVAAFWGPPGTLLSAPVYAVHERDRGFLIELTPDPFEPGDAAHHADRLLAMDALQLTEGLLPVHPLGFYRDLEGGEPDAPSLAERVHPEAHPDAERLAAYLDAGEPLAVSPQLAHDQLDPARPPIGGLAVLTDGCFAWPSQLGWYVRRHRVHPPPGLAMHARRNDWTVSTRIAADELELPLE